jgi:hypothetical protein
MNKRIINKLTKNNYTTLRASKFIKFTEKNPLIVDVAKTCKLTTENLKKEFNKIPTIDYKTKYPDIKFEEIQVKVDNLYKNQDKSLDFDVVYEFAKENLGYSKEFTRRLVYGENKKYFEKKPDGSYEFFWENIKSDITVEEYKKTWTDIEKSFTNIKTQTELYQNIQKEFQRMEWDELEKEYGEERIYEKRLQYNRILDTDLPEINVQELQDHVQGLFQPLVNIILTKSLIK